jgi:23S rRNA (cytosine1962-C5)-methyltransferase
VAQYEKLEGTGDICVVAEAGLRFEVNFDAYLDTGLFLDHRQTRALVAANIAARVATGRGTHFLNLFAYTGSFTVYAAHAGAESSLTLDLSNTYQSWTGRNLALNGIRMDSHGLERADVLVWLEDATDKGPQFDLIVLDPPSFSNSKKMRGVLDVQRDHVWLIRQCRALLREGGELFFSTNLRTFAMEAALAQHFGLREITRQTVPEDFKRPNHPPPHRAWQLHR